MIADLASRNALPTVYPFRYFVDLDGLISYGPSLYDEHRRAAEYVDRILRGAKVAELPVQAPTNYELIVNLKAATELGIQVPSTMLARANAVIE